MALVLRNVKGSKLTHTELDNNFLFLKGLYDALQNRGSVQSDDLRWNNIQLQPGIPVSNLNNGSFLNLNLTANPAEWSEPARFVGFNVQREVISDGAIGYIRNSSDLPMRIVNMSSSALVPLRTVTGSDVFLQPGEIANLVYSSGSNELNVMTSVNSAQARLTPKMEYFRLVEDDLQDPKSIVFKLENSPSEDEFVMVFVNGLLLNGSAIEIDENYIAIDKDTVEYEFKAGMKLTVAYKY